MAKKAGNIIKTDATRPKAIITDADYRTWIRDIASRDLRAELGVNEGFSATTLKYAKYFYDRQHEELNNFQATLPSPDSDLARQMIQSHYNWEFLQLKERYNETQLKDALCNNIIRTLISLGRGFSFLGREYRLEAPGIEKFVDLLFYIVPLHRYCVVEVKTTRFDFPDVGQITGYVNMVNDLLNTPIGIADYQVTTQELPEELQGYLPTYQELEHVLTQNAPHIPEEDNQDTRNLN